MPRRADDTIPKTPPAEVSLSYPRARLSCRAVLLVWFRWPRSTDNLARLVLLAPSHARTGASSPPDDITILFVLLAQCISYTTCPLIDTTVRLAPALLNTTIEKKIVD